MTDYLTVKEFADVAGVSSQRIYKLISTNSNGLATDIQQYCKSIKGRKYIHSDALKLFNDDSTAVNEIQHDSTAELNDKNSLIQSEVDVLKTQLTDKDNQINLLKSQIADRDKTIASLQADKEKLNARLDKAEAERERFDINISNLTAALTAAQALHGMDKQQAVIEVKEPASTPEPEQKELAEDHEPQKLSFFQRLFRKRSE